MAAPTGQVLTIDSAELVQKLAHPESFRLVMALGEWAFNAKRIPHSERFDTEQQLRSAIDPREEVIVYCTNEACHASLALYHSLVDAGYGNVRRYAGGIQEWEEKGLPLEGEWA